MDASFSLADFKFGKLPTQSPPLVGYRFGVYFLGGTGVMFPSDFRFSRVSGVGVRISEDEQTQKRAIPVYENLVLERGLPVDSPLTNAVSDALMARRPVAWNVLVSLLSEDAKPLKSWVFREVRPVNWSLSPFDANSKDVVVERIELEYQSFRPFSL
jgi:phage tail-like protein